MMIAMTHLDFYRVLSHHHCVELETPAEVGCPAKYNTQRLAIGASYSLPMGNRRGCSVFRAPQRPINGRFLENETGATP